MILQGYLFSLLYGILCLAFAFLLYKFGVVKTTTRKVVHILVGFEWAIINHFVGASLHFLAVCLMFLLLLLVAYRKKLMPMISSEGDNAPGTVYYAVAMSIMATVTYFIPEMMYPFGIGVFCTSFGDGLAGLIGQSVPSRINPKVYGNKSLVGAIVNFFVCFGTALAFREIFNISLSLLACVSIAILALELELFTGRGLDNISITLGTSALAFAFLYWPGINDYLVPIIVTPLIIAFAYSKKALTVGGIIGAIILDVAVSLALHNLGFTVLITFFVGSVIIDKIKKRIKKSRQSTIESLEHRSDCRDIVQVLSNGLVSFVCAALYLVTQNQMFVYAYVASLSEAFADTTASGVGALASSAFDPFRMKRSVVGLSGGMSLIGTVSSLVSSMVIAFIAFAFGEVNLTESLIIGVCGFAGGIFDSMLGSLCQVKYKCSVCGKILERREHCGVSTVKYSGVSFVNNDLVNLLGTAFSATLAFLILI